MTTSRIQILIVSTTLAVTLSGSGAIEVESRMTKVLSASDIADLSEIAKKSGPWRIEKIWTGDLSHPMGSFGARIFFETEVVETHAIHRSLDLMNMDWSPFHAEGISSASPAFQGKWFPIDGGVETRIQRIFLVGDSTVEMTLPDSLSYNTADGFIQSLSRSQYRRADSSFPSMIDMRKMGGLKFNPDKGELRLTQDLGNYSWDVYVFKVKKDHLVLIDIEHYQA